MKRKQKQLFSAMVRRCISFFSVKRNGRALDSQKWDDLYDYVISNRMDRSYSHK